jgi:hypothetical protein
MRRLNYLLAVAGSAYLPFAEGTGKLKGIKGKGTFHCSPAQSGGGWSCGGEGEYELAK